MRLLLLLSVIASRPRSVLSRVEEYKVLELTRECEIAAFGMDSFMCVSSHTAPMPENVMGRKNVWHSKGEHDGVEQCTMQSHRCVTYEWSEGRWSGGGCVRRDDDAPAERTIEQHKEQGMLGVHYCDEYEDHCNTCMPSFSHNPETVAIITVLVLFGAYIVLFGRFLRSTTKSHREDTKSHRKFWKPASKRKRKY